VWKCAAAVVCGGVARLSSPDSSGGSRSRRTAAGRNGS
jgi:hypothetical protein